MLKILSAVSLLYLCNLSYAAAVTILQCGASDGIAYYFEGGIIAPGEGGWKEDGISNGKFELQAEGNKITIAYIDSSGSSKSSISNGFEVKYLHITDDYNSILLVIGNDKTGVIEHYMFKFNDLGTGTVVWGTVRATNAFSTKSSLFTAPCRKK